MQTHHDVVCAFCGCLRKLVQSFYPSDEEALRTVKENISHAADH
jgi:hypothetical protein